MPEYYFEGNPGQTYTGPLTSAQYNDIINGGNVQDVFGSNVQGVYGRANQLADWLAEYSQKATTFNAREAATLRSWQEEQNRKAMEFSAQQAASNREWQEYMSNTAHQREIADLKAAGLNPILSVNGGAGASTPSGSYAQGVSSAGAKSEFDTSASGSLVNLLGSMLSSMTQIADTATNAQANLAYADIMSAASEYVAGLNKEASLGSAWLHAEAAKYGYDLGYDEAMAMIEWYEKQQDKEHAFDVMMEHIQHKNKKDLINTEYGKKAELQDDEQAHDTFIHKFYPQTFPGMVGSAGALGTDILSLGSRGLQSIVEGLVKAWTHASTVDDTSSRSRRQRFRLGKG